jgi:hypothetical protein
MEYTAVLIDNPVPRVRRVTLNRPHKRTGAAGLARWHPVGLIGWNDVSVRQPFGQCGQDGRDC